jgi:FkbH-like protein
LRFETSAFAAEDAGRQRSYVARAEAESLRETSGSLEDFWRSLAMRSRVRTLAPETVDRAAQLTQKTNQFNLTLVRRSREEVERLRVDPGAICKTLELEDRFANHGIVGLAIAVRDPEDPETAVIDTLLLSCRVIGRTAEAHLLSHLGRDALDKGFKRLRGFYVDGPRNALVADMYPRLGFVASPDRDGWEYDLLANGPVESTFIMDID